MIRYSCYVGDPFTETDEHKFFNTPQELEARFIQERGLQLSEIRCPHCGTRMIQLATYRSVPQAYQEIHGCINQTCPQRGELQMPLANGQLQPVNAQVFREFCDRARMEGLRRMGVIG